MNIPGDKINYKTINGTAYHTSTPDVVVNIIEAARGSLRNTRLRFCYGSVETGKDWGEIHDTTGYIGRSTGSIKIPLLIPRSNSIGGPGLLDHCIVKIEQKDRDGSYREVYRHPKYHVVSIHAS
jgi:hypothetical protein